jgi:23S rRNA (cytosine1962-C5)-methyltransferase
MTPKTQKLRIHVNNKAESALRARHPWLFSDSIKEQNREGEMGEFAVLYDRKDEFLGIGLYDPESPLRVRMLHVGKPVQLNDAWWKDRFQKAIKLRHDLFKSDTTGYRYLHGENDGFPGFVMDRYGDVLVIKIYTAAWFVRFSELLQMIQTEIKCRSIVLRLSRNVQSYLQKKNETKWKDGEIVYGEPISSNVLFLENGIRFEADVLKGQKTGFFLDQRENRQIVGTLCKGKRVLNVFSFSGAFSLYAAKGGAASVTDLDISSHALESSKKNFALNQQDAIISKCEHKTIQGDAFECLKDSTLIYDVIILDPPSLAKMEAERKRAIDAYGRLAARAIQKISKDGILVAASCSAHVSSSEFFHVILDAARQSGRKYSELQRTAQPKDHLAHYAEAEYLKCIYLKFSS